MSASRSTAERLPGSILAPPSGSAAFAALPTGVLDGQSGSFADGVDAVLYSLPSTANAYADPTAQLNATTTGFGTQLVSLQLASATDGSELATRDLATPILLALPRAGSGGGSCSSNVDCSGSRRGACTAGACVCASPYAGDDCGAVSVCSYWDASSSLWKTDGCVALEPIFEPAYSAALDSMGVQDSSTVVLCACDHLTTFAGLVEPDMIAYAPPPPSPPSRPRAPGGQAGASDAPLGGGGRSNGSIKPLGRIAPPTAAPSASSPVALIVGLVVGGGCALLCSLAAVVLVRHCRSARHKLAQRPTLTFTDVRDLVRDARASSLRARGHRASRSLSHWRGMHTSAVRVATAPTRAAH